jgi:hypothetical protein
MSDEEGAEVVSFPKWNPRVTAEQRFLELAEIARRNPEQFQKVVIGWTALDEGRLDTNYALVGCADTIEFLGVLDLVRNECFRVISR